MPVSYGRIKTIKERKGLIENMYHFLDSAEIAKSGWRDRSQACMCPALTKDPSSVPSSEKLQPPNNRVPTKSWFVEQN